jgi:nuclear pore complex protein Nup133
MDLIRQQRIGVELAISGMLSGESVVQILNAEPAGFILGFSSGRLGYMTVRDSQGRPGITVQFLRGAAGAAGSGIFGSLRNVLSSSAWRGDLAAARAGPVVKTGERDVVTVTSKGRIQAWSLHRGGHNSLQAEAEIREAIVLAMKESDPSLADKLIESFEVLDFTFAPAPMNHSETNSATNGARLLLLTCLGNREGSHYALVQLVLQSESFDIGMIRHIRSYTTPVNRTAISKPRLHLPNPGFVAFVVFDRAVVVTSMARQLDSPDSQLLADSNLITESFEDVIDFRQDIGAEITGSGMEEPYQAPHGVEDNKSRRHKAKFPAAVLLVRGGGIIRVAATDPYKLTTAQAPQVTAKSKLEQAVFFGSQENNPLDFSGRKEIQFTMEDIGNAALELSHEIISSTTPYIPSVPVSIDDNLRRRAAALRSLAAHLKETNVSLDRLTRWKLLWNAEKVAGATVVWNRYDDTIREKPVGQKHGLMTELVEYIHENYRSEPVAEAGELDRVRHWFIHDVFRLEIAVPWAFQAVKISYQEGQKDHATVMRLVSEADDFISGALDGAFKFRESHLSLYGLDEEVLENGILATGYEGLPEFWTSTLFVAESTKRLTDLAFSLAKEYWEKSGVEGIPDPDLIQKVRKENVQMVDLCVRSHTERFRWLLAQEDLQLRNQGEHLMNSHIRVEEHQIYRLSEIGLVDQAINLAEKHKVFSALVALVVEELFRINEKANGADEEMMALCEQRSNDLSGKVDEYYVRFGASFANALYKYYVSRGELFALLSDNDEHQQFLTNFLRSKPEYAKVSWIHEVTQEEDFDRAARALLNLGLRRERDLWSKKVELSIGKLARLAGKAYSETDGLIIPDGGQAELIETKRQLALIQIQDKIFAHVQPAISAAIDENAEIQLALEVYGNKKLAGKEALSKLLEENMGHLISHCAMDALGLIDLLTLMGGNAKRGEHGLIDGEEFYLALQALKSGPSDKDERGLTERVIWRRCMLRDDWNEINNTDLKDDQQVSYQLRRTALYSTLRACLKNRTYYSLFLYAAVTNTMIGLFEKPSSLSPVSPRGALGASTDELDERFRGLDSSVREPLLKDMQAEDQSLKDYIDKCRLEKWFEGALDLAKRDVQEEAHRETEDGEIMTRVAQKLREKEEMIAAEGRKAAMEMLRAKPRYKPKPKLNGSMGGFKSSVVRG